MIQKSKQWWLVRNNLGDEGNVPQKVLGSPRSNGPVADSPVRCRHSLHLYWITWPFNLSSLFHSKPDAASEVMPCWTWTPRQLRSKPGWSTKASPECETHKVAIVVLLALVCDNVTNLCFLSIFFLHPALWTLSECWLVSCSWAWPRKKYEQCVQKKEAKSSSSCRPSSHPLRWGGRSHDAHRRMQTADEGTKYSSSSCSSLVNLQACVAADTEVPPPFLQIKTSSNQLLQCSQIKMQFMTEY